MLAHLLQSVIAVQLVEVNFSYDFKLNATVETRRIIPTISFIILISIDHLYFFDTTYALVAYKTIKIVAAIIIITLTIVEKF